MSEPKGRNKRQMAAGFGIIFFLLLIVMLNYLNTRHYYRHDATVDKIHSLSDQTKKILRGIQKPVEMSVFYEDTNESLSAVKSLLKEYTYYSPQISYSIIDPLSRPDLVEKFALRREGTVVMESGGRRVETTGSGEVDFTSSLLKLMRDSSEQVIYFTTGHDELDPESVEERQGMSKFKEALEFENYKVRKLMLPSVQEIPADCAAIVIAGPKVPFLDSELELLKAWSGQQGRLLVLLDTPLVDQSRIPDLAEILDDYGVKAEHDFILDSRSFVSSVGVPLIQSFGFHQITKDFRLGIILAGARSISAFEPRLDNVLVEKIAETTAESWGKTDTSQESVEFDPTRDNQGPLIASVAIERTAHSPESDADAATDDEAGDPTTEEDAPRPAVLTRIILLGDADIASNAHFPLLGNSDFLLNSINWLCQQEELISIRPRLPERQQLVLSHEQWITIILIVFLTPVFFVGLAIFIWWKRR